MVRTSMGSGVFDVRQRTGQNPAAPPSLILGEGRLPLVGSARIYVCGITPYDVTHLGHAATFVWADLLSTVLEANEIRPRVCRNITDIDDVLTAAARRRGLYYDELALSQEAVFDTSMRRLRVAAPDSAPRARHYVEVVPQLAQVLLAAGAAYHRDGTVWFRGAAVAERSGLSREDALRLSADYGDQPDDPAKDDPFDVAVWRSSTPEDPAWPSPWGWGRPGWHAECAAMALAVHGACVDVLVGGDDLVFPHHAYQSAMVSAATGVDPFARHQLHIGEVRHDGRKMAKSTRNLVLVDDLLDRVDVATLRLLLLHRRYTADWDYTENQLTEARELAERLYAAAGRPGSGDPDSAVGRLRHDLDVPGAVRRALDDGGDSARRLIRTLRLG